MPTPRKNITIPQSGTYVLVMQIWNGPSTLAGAVCSMQIRLSKGSATALATIPEEAFTIDDVNRQVVLEITDEMTAGFSWTRTAVYDIYLEDAEGKRWRLLEGNADLSKTVTEV